VLSALAGVWGVASLVSPLVGGLFAQAGFWRGAFWVFAVQGVAFVAAAVWLVPAPTEPEAAPAGRIPLRALTALTGAILAIGAAGLATTAALAALLGSVGMVLLAAFLRLNARAAAPLIPRQAADPTSGTGAGLALIFCATAGSTSITVYLPALLQKLYGASPVLAGYLLVSEALAWTAAAFIVAHWPAPRPSIRIGAALIVLGMVLFAVIIPHGGLMLVPICTLTEGTGFGMVWAFTITRLIGNAPKAEQAIASASASTTQNIAAAVGSAASGVIAGLIGFGHGITMERATLGAFWLFAAFTPLSALGFLAALRLASRRFDTVPSPQDTVG
jgi:MFS family permease